MQLRLVPTLLFIAFTVGAWNHYSKRAISHSADIVAPDAPVQVNRSDVAQFSVGAVQITPVAAFSLEARVLSTERYHSGRQADLSPIDLALGWGAMSDSAVLGKLNISQGNRFYYYRWAEQPPISPSEIVKLSANMHMIPANNEIKERLNKVRVGHVVKLSGYLVHAYVPADGWRWNSSMTRSDSGNGACELMWVEDVSVR